MPIITGYIHGTAVGGGPPSYFHLRFRVTAQETANPFLNSDLMGCDSEPAGRHVTWNFNTALGGTGGAGNGYTIVAGNTYLVIAALHVHTSNPDDEPKASADVREPVTSRADVDDGAGQGLGEHGPSIDSSIDTDSTVDFEPCFADGTRDDD